MQLPACVVQAPADALMPISASWCTPQYVPITLSVAVAVGITVLVTVGLVVVVAMLITVVLTVSITMAVAVAVPITKFAAELRCQTNMLVRRNRIK